MRKSLLILAFMGGLSFGGYAAAEGPPSLFGHASVEQGETGKLKLADGLSFDAPARALSGFDGIAQGAGGPQMKRVRLIGTSREAEPGSDTPWMIEWNALMVEGSDLPPERLRFPLRSDFVPTNPLVGPGHEVPVSGKFVEAIEDAVALLAKVPKDVADEEEPEIAEENGKEENSIGGQVGGARSGNDDLANFNPQIAANKPEAVTTFSVTSEGCDVRISLEENVAVVQSRVVTTTDGVEGPPAECADGEQRLPIKFTREGCSFDIETTEERAYQEARRYYVRDGNTVFVTECERFSDQVGEYVFFPIVSEINSCPVVVSRSENLARQQAEKVFYDDRERRTLVAPCLPTEITFPVRSTLEGCSIRHDVERKLSVQQSRLLYTADDGVEHPVEGCTDSEVTFPHTIDYGVCEDSYNPERGVVIRQGRTSIQVEGAVTYITACQPGVEVGVTRTRLGCEGAFTHDAPTDTSYPHERHFYEVEGERRYLTSCQSTGEALPHHFEAVGWQNDDPGRRSFSVSQRFVVGPEGRVNIDAPSVIPNTPSTAYVYARSADVANGQQQFIGCNIYQLTDRSDIYTRPDGSEAVYANGAGASQGPTYGCSSSTETRRRFLHFTQSGNNAVGVGLRVCWARSNCYYTNFDLEIPYSQLTSGTTSFSAGAELTGCYGYGSGGHPVPGSVTNFFVHESRVRTSYPDGSTQYSGWAFVRSEQGSTVQCVM